MASIDVFRQRMEQVAAAVAALFSGSLAGTCEVERGDDHWRFALTPGLAAA